MADASEAAALHHQPPVVFLMGPTASGKTRLVVELARRLPLDIISVDSAMVYRGMDIGTGKPDKETQRRAPHRLIDIRDPETAYSADEFRRDALDAIGRAREENKIPFLVGGTGLYFRALRDGLSALPSADAGVRAQLAAEALEHGWEALHRRLAGVDAESAARIHANDAQRIQRALEIFQLSGQPMSRLISADKPVALPYPVHTLIIEPTDRGRLHADIAARFHAMLQAGLVEEVKNLRQRRPLSADLPALRAVGYRQIGDYLDGRCSYEQMVEAGIAATRQLARRQLTWLRGERHGARFDCHAADLLEDVVTTLDSALTGKS